MIQNEPYTLEINGLIKQKLEDGLEIWLKVNGISMVPFLQAGDKVLVKKNNNQGIGIGDLCLFENMNILYTHRLIVEENERFLFKGDHNPYPDNWFTQKQVWGKIVRVDKGNRIWNLESTNWRLINGILGWIQKPAIIFYKMVHFKEDMNLDANKLANIIIRKCNGLFNLLERIMIFGR